jgi:uncharacterized protein (TIGR02099 family)
MSIDQHDSKPALSYPYRGWHTFRGCCRIGQAALGYSFAFLFKLAILLYFVFGVLVLGLRYAVLPNIDAYKPQVEALATRIIGNPVSIGSLEATWSGLNPALSLDRVVIHDKHGNPALSLPNVAATLSWWTFAVGTLRLESLEINQPDLEIVRDPEGRLFVAGILVDAGKEGDGRGADWVLSQREIVIRDGRVRWKDQLRAAPELMLDDVDAVLQNRWRQHRFALRAMPPPEFAAPIDVRAAFQHPRFARKISDASRWNGEVYADLRDTDLTVWRAYFDYPADIRSGTGSVRAWLAFDHAKVADFTADLSLSQLSAQLQPELEPLNLIEVGGRVSIREDFNLDNIDNTPSFGLNGHVVSFADFTLRTDDGLFLPPTSISESYVPARGGRPARTEIRAQALDLEMLTSFAARLPILAEQRRILADLAPRGEVRNFAVQWEGVYPEVSSYSVSGRFAALSLRAQSARPARAKSARLPAQAAIPAIPGFENLTGRVEANQHGGTLWLDAQDLTLQLPGYFAPAAMPFENLNLHADWNFQGQNQLQMNVQKMDFVQEGIAGSLTGKHVMSLGGSPGAEPGVIDVNARLSRLDLGKVRRYLPLQTPAYLREWLTGALVGGEVKDVKIRVKGNLAEFPFRSVRNEKPKGEFSVLGRIEDGRLNYAPGEYAKDGKSPQWPLIDRINGSIAFKGDRMEIFADSARTSGTTLARVKVVLPELAADQLLLTVDGEAAGPLQNFVRFTHDSPVGEWIGNLTENTKASGNARLSLKLELPLYKMEESKVRGSLQFAGNTVHLLEGMPPLAGASGNLEFHENGFSIGVIRSAFLGGPVAISGGTQRDGSSMVRAEGSISAAGIRHAYAMPVTRQAVDRITGSTRYSTVIRVRDGRPAISVESSLVGIALDFPEPLRKAAAEPLPLRFELVTLGSSDNLLQRDRIKLALGSTINAHYERQKPAARDARWRVIRGGIGVNAPAPEPDSGVYANVSVASLNIDAWRRAVNSVLSPAQTGQTAKSIDALSIAQYIETDVLAARASELIVLDRKLDRVVVGASHQQGTWQANIDAEQVSGHVTWTESPSGQGLGRVTARLASLIIPKSAESEVSELLEGKSDTEQLPAVDIVADNFELFGKRLGRLELTANNARGPNSREWRINRLSIANPDGELSATGIWSSRGRGSPSTSALDYTLKIADAGRLLNRFGFANVLRGGKGRMEGDVRWTGPPFSLDIPSLSGQIRLDIAAGQFLKVDTAAQGAAKLLGVLSLQSLPRRLMLDFRDVFSEGFAFDGVTASATVTKGVAKTDSFKMRGVSATVLIAGTADIGAETQDLHVVVIPEINAGAASLVYGLAVNPVIGVGTFLAQLFLRDPLMKAFTYEYRIDGPWKDPVVNKLTRKPNGIGQAVLEPDG